MTISVFDLFKVGIGPSSSHTVGPMKAARMFAAGLRDDGLLPEVQTIRVCLYGSLGLTGKGHGSDKAVLLGLEGEQPATVDVDAIPARLAAIADSGRLSLLGEHEIGFVTAEHLEFNRRKKLSYHPNAMRFTAYDGDGTLIRERDYYSVGGGFVADQTEAAAGGKAGGPRGPYRARTVLSCPTRSRPARNCSRTPPAAGCPSPASCWPTRWPWAGPPRRSRRAWARSGRSCRPACSAAAPPTGYCRAG